MRTDDGPARRPALRIGEWIARDAPDGVLAYERVAGDERRLVMVNFTPEPVAVPAAGRVEVATDEQEEGRRWNGVLGADGGVVLAPG